MAKPDPTDKLLDELLEGKSPEEILGEKGLLDDLTKRLVERALEGEMTHHLGYPPAIRKVIYTTNAIESLQASLRKVTRNRAAFPSPESVRKILYLAIERISKR